MWSRGKKLAHYSGCEAGGCCYDQVSVTRNSQIKGCAKCLSHFNSVSKESKVSLSVLLSLCQPESRLLTGKCLTMLVGDSTSKVTGRRSLLIFMLSAWDIAERKTVQGATMVRTYRNYSWFVLELL